jgi:hypothetical protein
MRRFPMHCGCCSWQHRSYQQVLPCFCVVCDAVPCRCGNLMRKCDVIQSTAAIASVDIVTINGNLLICRFHSASNESIMAKTRPSVRSLFPKLLKRFLLNIMLLSLHRKFLTFSASTQVSQDKAALDTFSHNTSHCLLWLHALRIEESDCCGVSARNVCWEVQALRSNSTESEQNRRSQIGHGILDISRPLTSQLRHACQESDVLTRF